MQVSSTETQTRQMLTFLIITPGDWRVMLEHSKTFNPKLKNTDGLKKSLAVNTKTTAAGINQQGHSELHKITSSLCERWDRHLEHALRKTV